MPAAIMAGLALDCDLIASILNPNSAFSATPVTKLKSQANSYWFLTHSSGEWPVREGAPAKQWSEGATGIELRIDRRGSWGIKFEAAARQQGCWRTSWNSCRTLRGACSIRIGPSCTICADPGPNGMPSMTG